MTERDFSHEDILREKWTDWARRPSPELSLQMMELIFEFKNSLIIHKENTKESRNRVVSLKVTKTLLLFSKNFCGLENINFQNFLRELAY